jgi:hypothetical protein
MYNIRLVFRNIVYIIYIKLCIYHAPHSKTSLGPMRHLIRRKKCTQMYNNNNNNDDDDDDDDDVH